MCARFGEGRKIKAKKPIVVVFDYLLPWTVVIHARQIRQAFEVVFVTSDNCHNGEVFYSFCRRLARVFCGKTLTLRRLDLYDYMADNPHTVPKVFEHDLKDQALLANAISARTGALPHSDLSVKLV